MKTSTLILRILIASTWLLATVTQLHAQGSAFTYQGRLNQGGAPATGIFDLRFTIYDALTGGSAVGGPLTNAPTSVSNGLFTATLDAGAGVFTGADRWLEIGVRTNGSAAAYDLLSPRQAITATPYALRALGAGSAASYTGAITDGQLSANIARLNGSNVFSGPVQLNNSNNIVNGSFTGNGAGVTNVILETLNSFGAISWPGSFALASLPTVGTNSGGLAAADLNGDGKVDLISANYSSNSLSIVTNDGRGGFALASSPSVGNNTVAPVAADVNGDGKVDLACVSPSGTLSVLTNNGSADFAISSSLAVDLNAYAMTAADVNGDGKVDLILAHFYSNALGVMTNNGSGGFALAATLAVDLYPASVTAADVNGDGKVDLIAANSGTNTLSVLTNNGSGGFALFSLLTVEDHPQSATAADVNGDGKVDLISANSIANTLSILTNSGGSGGFALSSTVGLTNFPRRAIATDVNGDGKVDLVCATQNGGTISVLINNGSGGFTLTSLPATGKGLTDYIVGADVNGDGRLDMILAGYFSDTLSVLVNSPTYNGTFNGNGTGLLSLNANVPLLDGNQAFSGANTLSNVGNRFVGNGAGLTFLNATNLSSGTVPDARLSANIPRLNAGQTFTGANAMNNTGNSFSGNGSGLTLLSASSLTGGTLPDARLSVNVALLNASQAFSGAQALTNAANTVSGNGAGLTTLNASSLAAGTVADARLSSNVPRLNAGQTFTGANTMNNAANSFSGSGAGLTSLNASSLASGTVADARLSANVALLNGVQTFTGFPTFGDATGAPFGVGSTNRVTNLNADLLDGLSGEAYATDASVVSALSNKVSKAGDSMSGTLSIVVPNNTQGLSVQGNRIGSFTSALMYLNNSNTGAASPALRVAVTGNTADGVLHLTGSGTGKLASFNGASDEVVSMSTNGSLTFGTNATLSFGNGTRQMLNLWSNQYAIGVQASTLYQRTASAGGFAWFRGGVHNNAQNNPGAGGTAVMTLDVSGNLTTVGTMNAPAFNMTSDRNAKENFTPVDSRSVLDKVTSLPLSEWNFKEDGAIRHIGPMAQDFRAAFGVGPDDKHIATVDADGVALAAIQGLNQKVESENEKLREENAQLTARLEKLERLMEKLALR